jgi:hypothetical protein
MDTYHQLEDGRLSSETLQQFLDRQSREKFARQFIFGGQRVTLDGISIAWILNNIDCFVSQSRDNESVEEVYLYPYEFNGNDDEVWDKVGQALGNLQALNGVYIYTHEDLPKPNWERLARILSRIRQKVRITLDDTDIWDVEEVQALAQAIRGHPTITSFFSSNHIFPYESMDSLYSALVTLPTLESISISNNGRQTRLEDESTVAHHESLAELLRVPSLRSVEFDKFSFTPALCQATANAFMEGTAVTKLEFSGCSFSAEPSTATLAEGLKMNTSVVSISVLGNNDPALFDALAMALPSNSTLRDIFFCGFCDAMSTVFSALGKNSGLKFLKVMMCESIDEALCTAIKDGLELNETLESLDFMNVRLCDDNADVWRSALSFLHTNKALKSLKVNVQQGIAESCLATFRIDIAAMLQENASLESLSILTWKAIKAEEYIAFLTNLQHNTAIKTVRLHLIHDMRLQLNDDESKQIAALLKKNYALERLPDIDQKNEAGDIGAILRLNEAGRRYLIEDGSSISKGVEVLSRVNNEINCVFFHLLENPRLCDRSAVEKNSSSTSPTATSVGGKRERASVVYRGEESRRRLA